jgi:hypothetical protein
MIVNYWYIVDFETSIHLPLNFIAGVIKIYDIETNFKKKNNTWEILLIEQMCHFGVEMLCSLQNTGKKW